MITNLLVSAFCSCTAVCCPAKSKGLTASGAKPRQGVTVAASRSIPLGTRIYIETVGWRTVQDRLARRFDARCDVYFSRHSDARKFGIKKLKVTIIDNKK